MKWAFSIQQKTKAALLLAIVFLLVFVKNRIDRSNMSELGNSFSSVYEDRLLVESYIYQLSDHLYQKKMILDNCALGGELTRIEEKLQSHDLAIDVLIKEYEKTKFTELETTLFNDFKKNIAQISSLEQVFIKDLKADEALLGTNTQLEKHYHLISDDLHKLSAIQVTEGKNLADSSRRIVAGSTVLTQFELALLVVIALLIQALVFASRSMVPKTPQTHNWN